MNNNARDIRVAELFAGVGGFRLGLEKVRKKDGKRYKVVWSNQWEPATKSQCASDIYIKKFGSNNHSNIDISKVPTDEIEKHDLLVGGFPCQDYSVARVLSQAAGIEGKKGVLWWEIHRILKENNKKNPTKYILLENVDRLIKSPAKQRGRDFAIMLASLSDLGYIVEWRVINAADYGMPQRRKRIYILGYKDNTKINKSIRNTDAKNWLLTTGIFAKAFPISKDNFNFKNFDIEGNLADISKGFNKGKSAHTPFCDSGIIIDRNVWTTNIKVRYTGKRITIRDILIPEKEVPKEYFIDKSNLVLWKKLKGAKNEVRVTKDGFSYKYSEGPMSFPDDIDKPSRTIVTGEGGPSPSRFKHVIKTESGKLRRLTPVELEKLNMFPPNHTEGASSVKRAFLMGNALVVGVIEKIGAELIKHV